MRSRNRRRERCWCRDSESNPVRPFQHTPETWECRRTEVRELADIFRGRIVDVGQDHVMIEISGRENKIEAFIDRMRDFGILEMVRTGRVAMLRSSTITESLSPEVLSEASPSAT